MRNIKRVEISKDGKELTIVCDLTAKPEVSGTGKTLTQFSSGGLVNVGTVNGQPLKVNLSGTLPNPSAEADVARIAALKAAGK